MDVGITLPRRRGNLGITRKIIAIKININAKVPISQKMRKSTSMLIVLVFGS